MRNDRDAPAAREALLDEVVAEYLRSAETGRPLDRDALLRRYPELADDLARFFADRDRVEGWQFLEHRRNDPRLAGIPVVVISGAEQALAQAAALGITDFLPKPLSPEQLTRIFQHGLEAPL